MATLLYQGHGSLRMTTAAGTVVYVDPFAGEGYDAPADLILVTHQHHDHNCIGLPAKKADCRVIQNMEALADGAYQSFEEKDVKIQAVPAYNKNHNVRECVGYLVTADGVTVYFAGDTSATDAMKDLAALHLDYVLLPCDGIYNMNVREASGCAQLIGARHSIPIHMKPGALFGEEEAAAFSGPGKLVMRPGDELPLEAS